MRKNLITSLVVAALGALVAFAITDALRSEGSSSLSAGAAETTPGVSTEEEELVTEPALTPWRRQEIEEIGNRWAVRFAAGPLGAACRYETQGLCEWFACEQIGGIKIRNCTPPTSALRNSFFGATVQEVEIRDDGAAARFSNGEVVEVFGNGVTWMIGKVGGNPPRILE